MAAKVISKARFEALTYSVVPSVWVFVEVTEWYSDQDEIVLGVVCRDRQDNDWGYVVMGRDANGLFRAIDTAVSMSGADSARNALHLKLSYYAVTGEKLFPQGDENLRRKFEIFAPVITREEMHPNFVVLSEQKGYSPAKAIIGEIAYSFVDNDGNYLQQFQSNGFDARLWELFLYALFHENEFWIDRKWKAPDFCCQKFNGSVFIEAVTVNPTQGEQAVQVTPDSEPNLEKRSDYAAIKFGSALFSKLQEKYWELEHVKNHPLVFAIADFHGPHSMLWTHSALAEYLYATRSRKVQTGTAVRVEEIAIKEHTYGDKRIPSGFFQQPGAENVSAVLFSNSGTISKFNRMGKLAGFGDHGIKMWRTGKRYDHEAGKIEPLDFSFEVKDGLIEMWSEGVSMFHNPYARLPIDEELFPFVSHHFLEDGRMVSHLPEFFPFASITTVMAVDD